MQNIILTGQGPKIIDIDYSNERSLAKLTSLGRKAQIQEDVDQVGFIVLRILQRCPDVPFSILCEHEPSLRQANSISDVRATISHVATTDHMEMEAEPRMPVMGSNEDLVARVKTLLQAHQRISLRDLVVAQAKQLAIELAGSDFPPDGEVSDDALRQRVSRYEELVMPMTAVLANGCYWDDVAGSRLWIEALAVIGNAHETEEPKGGRVAFLNLRFYPAAIALYAAGIGAVANEQYETLSRLLEDTPYYEFGQRKKLARKIWQRKAEDKDIWNKHILGRDLYVPISDHLSEILREPMRDLLPHEVRYNEVVDRFEYLCGLHEYQKSSWGPVGRFIWKGRRQESAIAKQLADELANEGEAWAPLRSGFLKKGTEEATKVLAGFEEHVQAVRNQLHVW